MLSPQSLTKAREQFGIASPMPLEQSLLQNRTKSLDTAWSAPSMALSTPQGAPRNPVMDALVSGSKKFVAGGVPGLFKSETPSTFKDALREGIKARGDSLKTQLAFDPSNPEESGLTATLGGFAGGTAPVKKLADKAAPAVFEGFQDLSTKLLEKLKGRPTVSRQYIEDLTNSPDLKQAEKDLFRKLLEDEGDKIDIPTFANKVKSEQGKQGLREGQPPIGKDWNEATQTRVDLGETVARERFDIPKLEKLSFGGSDRDVYMLPNGDVLKVAKTPRGLVQNSSSADYYAADAGLIPNTIEEGKNYIVKEFVGKPDAKTKAMVNELKELDVVSLNGKIGGFDVHQKEVQKAIDILNQYGYPGDDLMNYSPLWGDMSAIRNWGTRDGKPILLDEGTLNGNLVLDEIRRTQDRGRGNLSDPEFRDIYNQSRQAKRLFGDTDKKTMYGIGAGLTGLGLSSDEQ